MCTAVQQQGLGHDRKGQRTPSPSQDRKAQDDTQGGDMHMTPMQQTEVMVRMLSESMKAVLKKRTRKRELWDSETSDDDDEAGSTLLSARKLLSGLDHDATLVEMSRLGVQQTCDLRLTTMTTRAWAERVNTLLTQNEGVRQRIMLSSRGKMGSKPIKGQREVEKRKWRKRQWIGNWEEMETLKKAVHEAEMNPEGAARVLKRVKEREAGLHKTGFLWDQARKDGITESAKSEMLQHAIGGMQQQYQPTQAPMGGMQMMQTQYQAYGGNGMAPQGKGNQGKGKGK